MGSDRPHAARADEADPDFGFSLHGSITSVFRKSCQILTAHRPGGKNRRKAPKLFSPEYPGRSRKPLHRAAEHLFISPASLLAGGDQPTRKPPKARHRKCGEVRIPVVPRPTSPTTPPAFRNKGSCSTFGGSSTSNFGQTSSPEESWREALRKNRLPDSSAWA